MGLSLENVSVISAGQTIIDDVSLDLEKGSMNVLLGPTLSGKTTLMRLMAGLDRPTSGRILVDATRGQVMFDRTDSIRSSLATASGLGLGPSV